MGWWQGEDGKNLIGDLPVNSVTNELSRLAESRRRKGGISPTLSELLVCIEYLVKDDETSFILRDKRLAKLESSLCSSSDEANIPNDLIHSVQSILNDIVRNYNDADKRNPSISEIIETFTYVLDVNPNPYLSEADELKIDFSSIRPILED